jgi:broad specificity phosphatase PhoE
VRHVHLVRHGEVENPHGVSYGRLPGYQLSATGVKQIKITGDYLRSVCGDLRAFHTSPLERAQESAAILAERLDEAPTVEPNLIEIASWRDGLPRRVAPLTYLRRFLDPQARAVSERPREVVQRMRDVVHRALALTEATADGSAVLVSHQAPIWFARVAFERADALGRHLLGVAPWLLPDSRCDVASVTTLCFDAEGRFVCSRYFAP